MALPQDAVVIRHQNYNYHYHNGYYYRPYGTSYHMIGAQYGIRINVLPVGYYSWNIGSNPFYYYEGTYYTPIPQSNQYQVTKPPVGTIVPSIPEDYNEVVRNGENLYEVNGILYKAIVVNNANSFEVVGYLDMN